MRSRGHERRHIHAPSAILLATMTIVAASGCRRVPSQHADMANAPNPLEPYPAPPGAGTVTFPHRPAGCPYDVRSVTPSHPRVSPHANRSGPDPGIRDLHITFVGDPCNTAVIQWSTGATTLASEVQFAQGDQPLTQSATGYSFSYGGGGARREHEVHLCGLSAGTRYRYRAGGAGTWSAEHSFVTAPEADTPLRVLVVGDARTNPAMWHVVAEHALAERPDVMLFTGDAVYDGASQSAWDAFFDAAPELLATTPGFWADGNHEGISEVYFALFAFPDNGQAHRHEHWYSSSYGPLHVVVLNDTTIPPSEQASVERDWLRRDLAAVDRTRTPWVVAVHHQPMYTDSIGHIPDAVTRAAWLPLWDEFHLNIDFAGHVHNYESSEPIHHGAVADDAHGTRFITFGGAGAPLYRFHAHQPWVHGRESTHGYGILTVSRSGMQWAAHREDGSLIEQFDMR